MKNTIIYLIGFAGTGKLTTAKEICKLADFKLIDNHYINNPIFKLIYQDGKMPLSESVWIQTRKIRDVILETVRTVCPTDYNFIFTNVLTNEDPGDLEIYKKIEQTALSRNSTFVPVHLTCELEENIRRVGMPDRKLNMKELSPEGAKRKRESNSLLNINHPNFISLDATTSPAEKTAQIILDHARNCAGA
jgi:hypothetical protein